MKPCIVLLTDFGLKDPFVGIVKGVILSRAPKAQIIDLNHNIPPFDVDRAAFDLESSISYFPKGSIFLCIVDPGVGTKRKILCARTKDYFIMAPDNGLLSRLRSSGLITQVRSVENKAFWLSGKMSSTFHGRDIIAPSAAALYLNSKSYLRLGPVVGRIRDLPLCKPEATAHSVKGRIMYFDAFGNAITDICRTLKPNHFWERGCVFVNAASIGPLVEHYEAAHAPRALWNSAHYLEITKYKSGIRNQFSVNDKVEVRI